jgi:uncharacterized protein YbbC (DUF1343 family)
VGAPWVKPEQLAQTLNARELPGVRFVPVRFTPAASAYAGQECGGVNVIVTDRNALDAPEMGLEIASALTALYPHDYKVDSLDTLMVNKVSLDALKLGEDPRRIAEGWRDGLEQFEKLRSRYLLY